MPVKTLKEWKATKLEWKGTGMNPGELPGEFDTGAQSYTEMNAIGTIVWTYLPDDEKIEIVVTLGNRIVTLEADGWYDAIILGRRVYENLAGT